MRLKTKLAVTLVLLTSLSAAAQEVTPIRPSTTWSNLHELAHGPWVAFSSPPPPPPGFVLQSGEQQVLIRIGSCLFLFVVKFEARKAVTIKISTDQMTGEELAKFCSSFAWDLYRDAFGPPNGGDRTGPGQTARFWWHKPTQEIEFLADGQHFRAVHVRQ
jgi:hypothetical protein